MAYLQIGFGNCLVLSAADRLQEISERKKILSNRVLDDTQLLYYGFAVPFTRETRERCRVNKERESDMGQRFVWFCERQNRAECLSKIFGSTATPGRSKPPRRQLLKASSLVRQSVDDDIDPQRIGNSL